jgi:hypothetical protein
VVFFMAEPISDAFVPPQVLLHFAQASGYGTAKPTPPERLFMDITFTPLIALFAGGFLVALGGIASILLRDRKVGSAALAAALCGGFAAYTAGTIYSEGVLPVLTNQASNMWGVQVWWDLLIAITIGLFLIAPRARAQGMNLPVWIVFVVATASIGLLAMVARLFWLEQAAAAPQAEA